MPNVILRRDVESKIEDALSQMTSEDEDRYLLEHNLGERCLAHRFAVHLAVVFSDWDVDCEYNRNGDKLKEIPLSDECRELLRRTDRVVPDIIVHKRGPQGPNLLAIEIKREGQPGEECDLAKLHGYISVLDYSYGFYVCFKSGCVTDHIAKKVFLPQ
jgi:hypothetical protein